MLTLLASRTINKRITPLYLPFKRYTSTMSALNQFVADVQAADPLLAGENDKDKSEISKLSEQTEGMSKDLAALNEKLNPLTYLYSNRPTLADVSLYCHLHPQLVSTPASQHPSQPSILRYFLQIQSLESVQSAQGKNPNSYPPLDIDVASLPIPERKAVAAPPKKEKKAKAQAPAAAEGAAGAAQSVVGAVSGAVAAASSAVGSAAQAVKDAVVGEGSTAPAAAAQGQQKGQKKEKKEKKEKPKAEPKVETGPMPSMIDMRVGKVLDVKKHPEADSLYVEQIDVGEAEPRTVCSGLVKYMSEDEIRGATIIVICNLKPVTMRGIKSYAMLLCASAKEGKEGGGVEFVLPPAGSQPGERIYFEGEKYENATPEAQLNPKKKVFETIQPGFTTLDNRDAAWIDPETKSTHLIRTKDGVCKAKSFVGASLS